MNELAVIDDGSLLIENGIIQAVGPSRRLENLSAARGAKILDASGRVVLPGFVDASTHLLKAIQQDNRSWAAARLQSEIRRGLRWFARHGTTTIETSTTSLREIKVVEGLKAKPLDIVASLCAHTAEEVNGLPKKAGTPLVACAHSGPGALTSAGVRDYVAAARRNGYIPRVYGPGTAGIALECGAAVLQTCGRMADSEIALIAHSATITLIGPLEMGLEGEAPAPARRLLDAGAAVALATGFNATGTRTLSMAVLISQAVTALGLTPEEAIAASTINAAHALSMARAVGSLEVGKYADFVMFDCADYRDIPSLFGANLVCLVAKRGVLLYEDSE